MEGLLLRDIPRSQPWETLVKARRLLSPKVGIFSAFEQMKADDGDVQLFYYRVKVADIAKYTRWPRLSHRALGQRASLIREVAMARALGEGVERYCSGMYDEDELPYAARREIAELAVHPQQFALFSERQYQAKTFPYVRFTEDNRVRWTLGYSLTRQRPVYVPAICVYVPYHPTREEEFYQPTSSGLAAGNTLEEAILNGLYEVVERDAYMIMWLNRLSTPQVDIAGCANASIQEIVRRFAACGVELRIHDLTTDIGIPTLGVLALSTSDDGPAAAVGAAAHLDPEFALYKALEEAALTRFAARAMLQEHFQPVQLADGRRNLDIIQLHMLRYSQREALPQLDFLIHSPCRRKLAELQNRATDRPSTDIRTCLELLSVRALEVIAVDLTTPEIAEVGFAVAKVLIPGSQPLDFDHDFRYLGGTRLYKVPQLLGYRPRETREDELNPDPHPFP
jgi:ribosomal protein S12 methylthiotransferase accessory factor